MAAEGHSSLLLCEAVLGSTWQIRPGERPPESLGEGWPSLDLAQMRERGRDSLVVPDADVLVLFRRYQARRAETSREVLIDNH